MSKGLTTTEAQTLSKQYGLNVIADKKKTSLLASFWSQVYNPLVILLLMASVVSFFIGETVEGALIITIILLNVFFGMYQEFKAEEAVTLLKKMTRTMIRVLRDGKETEIDSQFLVPGDYIFLEEGVKVPADARVVDSLNLELNEAALTGESMPVAKANKDEVLMGTIVARGRGWCGVALTGMNTKFGKIAGELSRLEEGKTPLQKKLEHLSEAIGIIGMLISLVVFVLSALQGNGYFPSFLLAVSLAVAIVPEGLPAVMTITLAIGVNAMTKKKAIVRKMSAIEALGSTTLIATDKTGTLTENNMKVRDLWVEGKIYKASEIIKPQTHALKELILNGVLCSTASLVYQEDHGHHEVLGDPTEGALLFLANDIKWEVELLKKEWQYIDEIPFDSVKKRMSVTVKKQAKQITYIKGAPEPMLEQATHLLIGFEEEKLTDKRREEIYRTLELWAKHGLRVLGFSYKQKPDDKNEVFLGLAAIHDAPRAEAQLSIKQAHEAGIRVVMITGDNEKTAEAIGKNIGLLVEGDLVIKGEQVEQYSDTELLAILPKVKIFARATPFHKSRIVTLYQKLGEVVVVTGDGVNDAIALKQSDVGAAMGRIGTDVARDAADLVITDDNFATIVAAVAEGRNIIKNLKNAIKYLFSANLSEALSIIFAFALGLPPLFIPIQLLYINLITDGVPALTLAFSPREKNVMRRPPERNLTLLGTFDTAYILLLGLFGALLVVGSYFLFQPAGSKAQLTAAFNILVMIQSFIFLDTWLSHSSLRNNYSDLKSRFFVIGFIIPFVCQLAMMQIPFFAGLFRVETVSLLTFASYVFIASLMLVGIKIVKLALKRKQ